VSPSVAVVAGALASKPWNGGEAWVRLSWALGLRRLGFHVVFVEELAHGAATPEALAFFSQVVDDFGLDGATLVVDGRTVLGRARDDLVDELEDAELLVNISGNLRDQALRALCRRRVYVDLDPGYTQIWHSQGIDVGLAGHHLYLTVGASLGRAGCDIPDAGVAWRFAPPPVVLDDWDAVAPAPFDRFTTVASWRGGYGRLERDGRLYGQKAHEFRRLRDLPRLVPLDFELALRIDPADEADRIGLLEHGWHLTDPGSVAGDPERFRDYVRSSSAEFSVAQGVYAETRCGWVSDRTVRYLASGRPALVQDTGARDLLPTGDGLVTFASLEGAVSAAAELIERYDEHARAARRLAEEVFDSDRVLTGVLADVGASP
jgi:hypothetical protein